MDNGVHDPTTTEATGEDVSMDTSERIEKGKAKAAIEEDIMEESSEESEEDEVSQWQSKEHVDEAFTNQAVGRG